MNSYHLRSLPVARCSSPAHGRGALPGRGWDATKSTKWRGNLMIIDDQWIGLVGKIPFFFQFSPSFSMDFSHWSTGNHGFFPIFSMELSCNFFSQSIEMIIERFRFKYVHDRLYPNIHTYIYRYIHIIYTLYRCISLLLVAHSHHPHHSWAFPGFYCWLSRRGLGINHFHPRLKKSR